MVSPFRRVAAPDGSLIVADWYDPGVGGMACGSRKGRLFMVAPDGHQYKAPKVDVSNIDGAVVALKVRIKQRDIWLGMPSASLAKKPSPPCKNSVLIPISFTVPALWILGKIPGRESHYVNLAIKDENSDIRIVGLRLARQLAEVETISVVSKLTDDPSPQVLRECAIALRHEKTLRAAKLWAELAARHDGKDRWYLEALGLSSDLNADACFDAWLAKVGDKWNTPAGRDIVWRIRAKSAPSYLVKILKDEKLPAEGHPRYVRAFDFHSGPEKDKALESLLDI